MKMRGEIITVPIKKIFPNKWNPNEQSDFMYEREIESIKSHGMLTQILVREIKGGYEIIDGEHRWRAATDLGIKEARVNNLGKISNGEAKKLTLILNEIRGKADPLKLSTLMGNLLEDFSMEELTKSLPFSELEMSTMINNLDVDWSKNDKEEKSGEKKREGWETVSFNLPEDIAKRLNEQIARLAQIIEKENSDVPHQVQIIEFLIVHLEQTQDKDLV